MVSWWIPRFPIQGNQWSWCWRWSGNRSAPIKTPGVDSLGLVCLVGWLVGMVGMVGLVGLVGWFVSRCFCLRSLVEVAEKDAVPYELPPFERVIFSLVRFWSEFFSYIIDMLFFFPNRNICILCWKNKTENIRIMIMMCMYVNIVSTILYCFLAFESLQGLQYPRLLSCDTALLEEWTHQRSRHPDV